MSMCASSMMKTLRGKFAGATRALFLRSRISSMPRLEAASISMTSRAAPESMASQAEQELQGSPFALNSGLLPRVRQFTVFAIRRAVVVLPTPRGPEKR